MIASAHPRPLRWKIGFEIELLAPRGRSRRDLAERVAASTGCKVQTFFHPQSEPSKVPGSPVFENLTHGFAVADAAGAVSASFVDDLTLQGDLRRDAPPVPGWYRIVADDGRLLRLVKRQCDPEAPAERVLDPIADLFGTVAEAREGGMVRVADERGASVALCANLPGERERPCEIVTAPIENDHAAVLEALLGHARALDFTVPREGAAHLHFDADALCSAPVVARVVALFGAHRERLRELVNVNPNCVRLGAWPTALSELTKSAGFAAVPWPEARQALRDLKLSKYCDFNLLNLAAGRPEKHTFEIRILPASLRPEPILAAATLFESLLEYCLRTIHSDEIPGFDELLLRLELPPETVPTLAGIRGRSAIGRSAIQQAESLLRSFP